MKGCAIHRETGEILRHSLAAYDALRARKDARAHLIRARQRITKACRAMAWTRQSGMGQRPLHLAAPSNALWSMGRVPPQIVRSRLSVSGRNHQNR